MEMNVVASNDDEADTDENNALADKLVGDNC